MKKTTFMAAACAAFLAASCAHKSEQANYQSTTAPIYSGTTTSTTYNDQINQRSGDRNTSVSSSTQYSSPQASTTFNSASIQTQNEPSAGDSALISQVRAALNNDTTLVTVAPSVQVTAVNGTVTLSGNVSNEQQKQTIEHVVKGTSGVVTVNNQLQVAPSPTGQSSQSSIYRSVAKDSSASTGSYNAQGSRLYSTKNDFSTNSTGVNAGASGEASLGSTNSTGSLSSKPEVSSADGSGLSSTTQSSTPSTIDSTDSSNSSSLNSTNSSENESPNLSATSPSSSSPVFNGTDTNQLSSVNSGETKDLSRTQSSDSVNSDSTSTNNLSPTSDRSSSRVYSTNETGQASGFSSDTSSSSSLNLTVQGSTEADQKLADQVRQELRGDTSLSGSFSRMRISLDNGKATLRGFVKSDAEKEKIEKSVQKITGVTSVQNELRVGSSSGSLDSSESK